MRERHAEVRRSSDLITNIELVLRVVERDGRLVFARSARRRRYLILRRFSRPESNIGGRTPANKAVFMIDYPAKAHYFRPTFRVQRDRFPLSFFLEALSSALFTGCCLVERKNKVERDIETRV